MGRLLLWTAACGRTDPGIAWTASSCVANLAAIDHLVRVIRAAVKMERNVNFSKRMRPPQALFFEVTAENDDQQCSTLLLQSLASPIMGSPGDADVFWTDR